MTKKQILEKIVEAARSRRRLDIRYMREGDCTVVRRSVAPYELRDGYLWATDKRKGAMAIRSFLLVNILSASVSDAGFRPVWEVKL